MTTQHPEEVRRQFEAWAVTIPLATVRYPSGAYRFDSTQWAWRAYQAALRSPAVAGLVEAAKAWDRWSYEVQSAKANGESIYSFDELQAMRTDAQRKSDAALAQYATLAGEKA
jgi:hypothetical protein